MHGNFKLSITYQPFVSYDENAQTSHLLLLFLAQSKCSLVLGYHS